MMDFTDKNVLIVGSGISGQGAFEALKAARANCFFYGDKSDFEREIDLVVVSPGIALCSEVFKLAQCKSLPVIGEIELGFLLCHAPIIAVTGTNGKTTITELIGKMLQCAGKNPLVCGNIGIAFSQAAQTKNYDVAVVEVSSFQLETIDRFKPHVAIISNITPDHLDRHKTMSEYAAAKLAIAKNQTSDDYLIVTSAVKPFLQTKSLSSRVCCIGDESDEITAYLNQNNTIYFGTQPLASTSEIAMTGEHNLANAMLAATACKIFGVSDEAIRSALRLFAPRAFRVALSGEHDGKKYFNDSKGTNIDACLCACNAMQGATCLIVGGSDKGYDFSDLFTKLPPQIKQIYAVGQTADKVLKSAQKVGFSAIQKAASIREATHFAAKLDVANILLSPAAASFDSYANYEERGKDFDRVVAEIMHAGDASWS